MHRQEESFQMKNFNIYFELGNLEQFGGTEDRFIFSAPREVNMYLETDEMVDFVNALLRWEEMLSDKHIIAPLVETLSKRLGSELSLKYLIATKIGEKYKIKILEFDYIDKLKKNPQLCLKMKIDSKDDVYQLCSWFLKKKRDSKETAIEIKQVFD